MAAPRACPPQRPGRYRDTVTFVDLSVRALGRAATIKTPVRTGEGGFMLWTVVVILVILWLLGMLGTVSIPMLSGNTVHVLLVIVIIIVAIQLLQRRRL
jgi:hypothetical protein